MIMLELRQKSRIHWPRLLYHVSYRRDMTNDNVRVETKVKDPLVQTAVACWR